MANIGFIGLGNMGGPMAGNLVKNGHAVKVFDLSEQALEQAQILGATPVSSSVETAKDADFLITMLPAGKHVQSVLVEKDALLDVVPAHCVVIDSSTIDADTARQLAGVAQNKGIAFVDAPVSGGVKAAAAGTLSFMVGGPEETFSKVEAVLGCMGKNIFHAGPAGAGQIAKACNNMVLAITMTATSEALNLGMNNGLDPKVLSEIMAKSSGNSWVLQVYNPTPGVMDGVPASNNYEGGFKVDLMCKDLGLALEASQSSKSPVPLGSVTAGLYGLHQTKGNGELDFSSIFKMFQTEEA